MHLMPGITLKGFASFDSFPSGADSLQFGIFQGSLHKGEAREISSRHDEWLQTSALSIYIYSHQREFIVRKFDKIYDNDIIRSLGAFPWLLIELNIYNKLPKCVDDACI